jgi:hypothetical protein
MGSTGVDQETHAGEHSVQTLPLGIRERRESHLDNLKRRKTKGPSIDQRTTGNWREKKRRANPHRGSEVLQPRKGRGGWKQEQLTSREHAVRTHLEAALNDFWSMSNLPGAAGSIGGGLRRSGGDAGFGFRTPGAAKWLLCLRNQTSEGLLMG